MPGIITDSYWDKSISGYEVGYGINGNGTFSDNTALTTTQMKQQSQFLNLNFSNIWQIRENQTYPALKKVPDNAPFSFNDSIRLHQLKFPVSALLLNDYDYETFQNSLTINIENLTSGNYGNDSIYFQENFPSNVPQTYTYRIGEIIGIGDTLWGNRSDFVYTFTNYKPVITGFDNVYTDEDTPITIITDQINYSDEDGDSIKNIILEPGSNYAISELTITPSLDYYGNLYVPVRISDGMDTSEVMILTIIVNPVNDPPVIVSFRSISTDEDTPYTLAKTDINYTDVENDTIAGIIIGEGNNYTVDSLTITPTLNYFGNINIPVQISDGTDTSDVMILTIIVNPVNDAPVITSTAPTTATVGVEYVYHVAAFDVDNPVLTYSLSNQPNGMIITDTTITWTPAVGVSNSGIVTLSVSDGSLITTELFIVYVSITGVFEVSSDEMDIYPNPTHDFVHIIVGSHPLENLKYLIYDGSGKIVASKIITCNTEQIDLSCFANGFYFISIYDQEKLVNKVKIIKY